MKKIILFTFLLALLVQLKISAMSSSDNVLRLDKMQSTIQGAYEEAIKSNSIKKFTSIEKWLLSQKKQEHISQYWMAYERLYKACFYLAINNKEKGETTVNEGCKILEDIEKKNSEDYALLAQLQSYSIKFLRGMEAGVMSNKSAFSARKSVELDAENLRGWYVLGVIDYFTPKEFGGQTKCEKYLQKSISLKEQVIPNAVMPSWGKSDAYSLLIKYYIQSNNRPKATATYNKAISQYPHEYTILQYKDQVKN